MRPLLFALAVSCAALSGCSADEPAAEATRTVDRRFEIEVAPEDAPCTGVAPMRCLQVRRDPQAAWELHYFGIEGFDYQPGYTYRLLVEERPWVDPPADAPSSTWHLVRVIAKDPAS
ncbi:DUF4377 domain-containing protein [Nocardia sp. NPDC127579]|uniref:DUF4377 domain-containing protein n=1 Tax=Nocardia sp. NPDC127579 TaxID=3345402 RepID=UPI003632EE71